jgi:hypothetical protein
MIKFGLPGERIRVAANIVRIGGEVVEEPYATWSTPLRYRPSDCILACDQCFVVGDNRAMSTDSRRGKQADTPRSSFPSLWPLVLAPSTVPCVKRGTATSGNRTGSTRLKLVSPPLFSATNP